MFCVCLVVATPWIRSALAPLVTCYLGVMTCDPLVAFWLLPTIVLTFVCVTLRRVFVRFRLVKVLVGTVVLLTVCISSGWILCLAVMCVATIVSRSGEVRIQFRLTDEPTELFIRYLRLQCVPPYVWLGVTFLVTVDTGRLRCILTFSSWVTVVTWLTFSPRVSLQQKMLYDCLRSRIGLIELRLFSS